jgi:heme-degrading monooxygenase HmoA
VKNYDQWKAVFDEHAKKRKQLGSKGGKVFRNSERPDEIFVLVEWEDLTGAKVFSEWGRTRYGRNQD